MKKFVLVVLCVLAAAQMRAAAPRTMIYDIKESDTLRLDFYEVSQSDAPCVVFMFGGGFFQGNRYREDYARFFEYLNSCGYAVASIDYRLGLAKLRSMTSKPSVGELVTMLTNSVDMAVSDLYSATRYLLANHAELGISPSKIITCGSSAGAISVLTAEWRRSEGCAELPEDFAYAGVISFAGAVYSSSGAPRWNVEKAAPVMLYHGDADSNVPYRKLVVGKVGMWGSDYIYDKFLRKSDKPYYMCVYLDVDHVVAGAPYLQHHEQIDWFIDKIALGGREFQVYDQMRDRAYPAKQPPRTIFDYIKANFGQ